MSRFLWHTIVDTYANLTSISDNDNYDLYKVECAYSYHQRNINNNFQPELYLGWTFSAAMATSSILGQDNSDRVMFEQFQAPVGGMARYKFLIGQVTDASGNPLLSCVVQLYDAVTGALISSGVTDQNGYYMLPTPNANDAHFVYANYNNGQFVGASVNTLTPNF